MDPVTFTVLVSDGRGQPLPVSQVGAELTMPTMDMGRNTVALIAAKPGLYTGTGRFSMDGDWVVAVTAVSGSDRVTQTFPLHVR